MAETLARGDGVKARGAKRKLRFVVTAGPTREWLDPVRFLSNPSSGKMGFAIAAASARRGHDAILVAGPVSLPTPRGVERIDVETAREMQAAVKDTLSRSDPAGTLFVAAAAVADWRPARTAAKKLKKSKMDGVLRLVRNPDILKSVRGFAKIGFAAETGNALREAARKLESKNLEMIVANDVSEPGAGFGTDTNRVVILKRGAAPLALPLMPKSAVARAIVEECEKLPLPFRRTVRR